MALVYEKTWSQRYTNEQGVTWQLTDLEAHDGEVFERWQVIPQVEEPLPEKREPTGHDKDEPTGHDNNEVLERKMPRLRTVSVYARAV